MTAIAVVAALVVAEAPVFGHRRRHHHHHCHRGYGVLSGNHRPAAIAQSLVQSFVVVIVVAPAVHHHYHHRRRHLNTVIHCVALVDSC